MSHNTAIVTIITLGHPHVMGRGSGIPSIENNCSDDFTYAQGNCIKQNNV